MEKIQGVDFARPEVFIQKVFCGFSLIRKERVDFPDIRNKGLINVYFMIIHPEYCLYKWMKLSVKGKRVPGKSP